MAKQFLKTAAIAGMLSVSSIALAQPGDVAAQAVASTSLDPQFATFAPNQDPNNDSVDYSIWDEAMKNIVISMGPSLRETAGSAEPGFGSRRIYGHRSRYRLEGTRIMFSFLDADVISTFGLYRQDLQDTASQIDIQSLSRNEQLAYWINLHNVAMVEQIANNWPVRQPKDIKVGGVPLDDAKFITVEGVSMSPKDIRTKIVYQHWRNPMVMYGFWRGDIGGPSIQREAYNADNVGRLLERGARDFVNSLRGTQKLGKKLQVSTLYEEAAPFYFNNFEADVRAHIAKFANDEVKEILGETSQLEATIEEPDIADLAGGVREPSYSNITTNGSARSFRIPQSMARLLQQRQTKIDKIIREGRTGTVTFSNITLPGEGETDGEVE